MHARMFPFPIEINSNEVNSIGLRVFSVRISRNIKNLYFKINFDLHKGYSTNRECHIHHTNPSDSVEKEEIKYRFGATEIIVRHYSAKNRAKLAEKVEYVKYGGGKIFRVIE